MANAPEFQDPSSAEHQLAQSVRELENIRYALDQSAIVADSRTAQASKRLTTNVTWCRRRAVCGRIPTRVTARLSIPPVSGGRRISADFTVYTAVVAPCCCAVACRTAVRGTRGRSCGTRRPPSSQRSVKTALRMVVTGSCPSNSSRQSKRPSSDTPKGLVSSSPDTTTSALIVRPHRRVRWPCAHARRCRRDRSRRAAAAGRSSIWPDLGDPGGGILRINCGRFPKRSRHFIPSAGATRVRCASLATVDGGTTVAV
jgi:hypothetical protein